MPSKAPRLKDSAARAINSLLARANLALVRRDRHDALAEAQVRRERQALGRDAAPLAFDEPEFDEPEFGDPANQADSSSV